MFFFKHNTAYEMRISDWSSDVCSSDLGDGDMMEGVSSEAASLAGHLGLSNLCWIYDDNHISIEGNTNLAFTEDTGARFAAYGWNVVRVSDANDLNALTDAYQEFLAAAAKPTLMIVRSHNGYGEPTHQDTPKAHGEPLGPDNGRRAGREKRWKYG